MSAQTLLAEAQAAGLSLWLDDGRIRCRCAGDPPGELLQRLREHKHDLLALLTPVAVPDLSAADEEGIAEALEERAAIRQFEGGESKEKAEREARSAMRVYRYRLSDKPDTWLTMIAPGCDMEEARYALELRFGERVLDVLEHQYRRRVA